MDRVVEIERHALTAWPALAERREPGWLFRFSGGCTRRGNSANVLDGASLPPTAQDAWLDEAEAAYHAAGLPCIFRETPVWPEGLAGRVAARGYEPLDDTLVLAAPIDSITAAPRSDDTPVHLGRRVTGAWVDCVADATELPAARRPVLAQMLTRLRLPARFAVIEDDDGAICAAGLAVGGDGLVGLFDIATREDARGRGYARLVVGSLLEWARSEGAETTYLQVVPRNLPALAVYQRLGFATAYAYRYHVRAASQGTAPAAS